MCVFTNNPGWGSPEKHAEREQRWRQRTRNAMHGAVSERIASQASGFLRSFQTSGDDYCQAGVPDWYKNFDQIPYDNTDACYKNCYYNLGDSAWEASDSYCYQPNHFDGAAWRSASWSMPCQPRPYDDWGIASRQTVQDYQDRVNSLVTPVCGPWDDRAKAVKVRASIDEYNRKYGKVVEQRDAAVAAKSSQQ